MEYENINCIEGEGLWTWLLDYAKNVHQEESNCNGDRGEEVGVEDTAASVIDSATDRGNSASALPLEFMFKSLDTINSENTAKLVNAHMKSRNPNLNDSQWFESRQGHVRVIPGILHRYMLETWKFRKSDSGKLWVFNGKFWQEVPVQLLASIIKEFLPEQSRTYEDIQAVCREFQTDAPDTFEDDFNNDENIIGFQNGVLDISKGELISHDSKHLITRIVNADYVSGTTAEDTPRWNTFLSDAFPNDDTTQKALMEVVGAILSNVWGSRYKSFFIIAGPGNTGKSKILELVQHLLGEGNYVSIDLKHLQDRFGVASLHHKRLAGAADMEFVDLKDVNILKQLTGQDKVHAERKYENPFSFTYRGFLMFCTNQLPHFRGDRGEHVYERIMIFPLNHSIPEERRNPYLIDELLKEKNAIASRCVDIFVEGLKHRGNKFTESDVMKEAIKHYKIENNTLFTFVNECCFLGEGTTRVPEFKKTYKAWCRANNYKPEGDRAITCDMKDQFAMVTRKTDGNWVYDLTIDPEICSQYGGIYGLS